MKNSASQGNAPFDPFNDFQTAGYLRNRRGDTDLRVIKAFEQDLFAANMELALEWLQARKRIAYADFLEVHRILFEDYYPWAGKDRAEVAPDRAISKGSVKFALPSEIHRAVEHGLHLGNDKATMKSRPGEVMGLFAYGHPFLDCNGRTMLLVHMELSHRAGMAIDWAATKKSDYLDALTQEIEEPNKHTLDRYLVPFIRSALARTSWTVSIASIQGLDGMDGRTRDDGLVSDPATAREYADFKKKRAYSYSVVSTAQEDVVAERGVEKEAATKPQSQIDEGDTAD